MRLTLRTLLAYMDDILEPADHEELSKKIESSDFATELIHRCRDTVRRLRLGAPAVAAEDSDEVLGGDMTADANTVSEYLDNTLQPESVAEFERICLEPGMQADMHLAEVSSCHHILTMVLGEPAEIDVRIRERMYALPGELASGKLLRVEPSHPGFQAVAPAPASIERQSAPTPAASHEERSTEVPDYLRAASRARRSRIRWLTAAAILAMVAGVGYVVLAPVPEQEVPEEIAQAELEFGELEIGSPAPAADALAAEGGDSPAPPFVPGETTDETNSEPTTEGTASAPPTDAPAPPIGAEDYALETPDADGAPPTEDPLPTTTTDDVATDTDAQDATARTADTPPAELAMPPKPVPPQVASATHPGRDAVADDSETSSDEGAGAEEDSEADLAEVPPSPEPEGPVQLGNYLGGSGDVLLRRDGPTDKWIRLPSRTSITSGDRLLVLPKFRTHIALADANVYLSGGTQVVLAEPEESSDDAVLALNIVYGRLLLNAGLSGSQLHFEVGDQLRKAKLGGSASLAVEVRRVFVPGGNLEEETAPLEASWYLTSGSVEWPGPAGVAQTISAPSVWKTLDGVDELPQPIDELPAWIDREEITDLERRARTKLAEELTPGQAVGLTLLALNDPRGFGRQREVRTLAAESSLFVGEFEPFVKSLSDADQSRYWESHIDSLRAALALSPALATRVREAFVSLRGAEAAGDLMEMVQGFSPEEVGQTREELQQGALVKLLGWLDSDSLDYRVLAIYNLNEITGTSYLAGYRPDLDSTQRRRALRKLWDRFEANELLPAMP